MATEADEQGFVGRLKASWSDVEWPSALNVTALSNEHRLTPVFADF